MKFNVEVSWTVISSATIEADTEEEARRLAMEAPLSQFPGEEYLTDSFSVDVVTAE